jgi:hypothetical protein
MNRKQRRATRAQKLPVLHVRGSDLAANLPSQAHAMLADLRSMLETDWNDERPELTFFCQGGDGRAYQVTPERVGVEEKPLLVGTLMEFFAERDVTSYTFIMEVSVLPSEASDCREMLIVGAVGGHKAVGTYFVECDANGKRSLGEWSASRDPVFWATQLLGAEPRTVH